MKKLILFLPICFFVAGGAPALAMTIPEPATMLLFGFGLIGVAGITKRMI